VGQTAQVICDAFGAQQFAGRVVRLAPVLRQETRSGEVEIEIANPTGRLKPGMFAKVELRVNRRRELLLAPDGALIKTPSGHGVYRVEEGAGESAKVQLVPVRIGVARDGHTEVQGALTAGDRVVTVGVHLLKDGQRVRVGGAKKAAGRHDS
jgi:RND family efflux transporter MFP subunit